MPTLLLAPSTDLKREEVKTPSYRYGTGGGLAQISTQILLPVPRRGWWRTCLRDCCLAKQALGLALWLVSSLGWAGLGPGSWSEVWVCGLLGLG